MFENQVNQIRSIIDSIGFVTTDLLNSLGNRDKLNIFLTGKSGSGKTMLLNSLLGLNNEFYTSNKVATLAQFKIAYGEVFEYSFTDSMYREFPKDIDKRRAKLKELNESEKIVYIHFPEEFLKGINIIDIPGFFDFNNLNRFMNELLSEADFVIFLKYYKDMLSPEENEFLNSLIYNDIRYSILFTKTDIKNIVEGLDKKTIPNFVKQRLGEYGEFYNYFLISAKRDKDSVENLKNFLIDERELLLKYSIKSKINRVISYYTDLILNEKNSVLVQIEKRLDKYCAQFEKEQNEKLVSLNDKMEKMKLEIYHLNGTLIKNIKSILNSNNNNKTVEINENWEAFWDNINKLLDANNAIPQIPFINERMFEKTDDILESVNPESLKKIWGILNEEETKQKKQKKQKKNKKNKKNNNELKKELEKIIFDKDLLNKVIKFWQVTQIRTQWLEYLQETTEYELTKLVDKLEDKINIIKTECDRDTKKQEVIKESNILDLDKAKEELGLLNVT